MSFHNNSSEEEDNTFNKNIYDYQQNVRANYIMNSTKNYDIDNERYSFIGSPLFWICVGCCLGNLGNQ